MPRCILALDQGTTSSRAIVFAHDGAVLGIAQQEFPQHFPQPGWVEHDAEDIWNSQAAVAVEALGRAGVTAAEIAVPFRLKETVPASERPLNVALFEAVAVMPTAAALVLIAAAISFADAPAA